jgi:hypothetical protein
MWKNVEGIAKIKVDGVSLTYEQIIGVTKSRKMTKLVTVDLDLIKPCWEEFNLNLKKNHGHV